jgi:Flp pilus assembly protein TadD
MLDTAARLAPDEPRYAYTHALALHRQGRVDDALAVLARHPGHRASLIAAATFERDRGRFVQALGHARAALAPAPGDRDAVALLAEIERRLPR